jgi:cold-inducible RNA-binding protein
VRTSHEIEFRTGKKLVNIYCGNISYTMNEDDLRELFGEYGSVGDANVIIDRDTGRSKGFGFVEMANDGEANAAIKALDGLDNGGRELRVNEARPREPRR